MEDETIEKLGNKVKEGLFRNKSHLIEYAVNNYLKEGQK